MTQSTGNGEGNRFCKACGTPAEDGKLCNHCGAVLDLPDGADWPRTRARQYDATSKDAPSSKDERRAS
ncbi:hypothetical protein [Streptomyces prasinus]|uniref:hypothetical protein n=1 Tax=Streptomyces prasinus TaxID=67345 RepID=UPI0033AECC2C